MLQHIINYFASCTFGQIVWLTVITTVAMELFTLALRFGLKLEYAKTTQSFSSLTFNIRIHHSFTGLLILILTLLFIENLGWRNLLLTFSIAMIASDLIHHFLILWPITGSPQFHLTYSNK